MGGVDRETAETGRQPDSADRGSEAQETTALLGSTTATAVTENRWTGLDDFDGLPWWRKPSVYWLLAPYMLFTLAFGCIIVPKLNLIIDLVCRKYFAEKAVLDPNFSFAPVFLGGDNPQCRIPEIQRTVSNFTLSLNLIVGLLSGLVAPKLGHLSDRYGRTRFLAISACGSVVAEAVTILAAKYPDVIHYRWLLVSAVFDGMTGSFTAGSVLGGSYASDCTPPSKRGVAIGYLYACFFSGLAAGPMIGGYIVEFTGSLLSIFYIAITCHIIFILFVAFVIPESVSRRRQLANRDLHNKEVDGPPQRMREWFVSAIKKNPLAPLAILSPRGPGTTLVLRRNLLILSGIDATAMGCAMGGGTVVMLYSEYKWGWGNFETSRFVSVVSTTRAFILLGLLPVINYLLRARLVARRQRQTGVAALEKNAGADEMDIWLIRVALAMDMIGELGYVFARTPTMFVFSGIVTAFGGLATATVQATVTKHMPPDKVGQVLGAIGLLHSLGRVFAPIVFNGIYSATIETFPQAIFSTLAGAFGLSLLGSLFVRPHIYLQEDDATESEYQTDTAPLLGNTGGEEVVI